MKCFRAQLVKDLVVIDFNRNGFLAATVQNTGDATGDTQAAARTRALCRPGCCIDFDFHCLLQK